MVQHAKVVARRERESDTSHREIREPLFAAMLNLGACEARCLLRQVEQILSELIHVSNWPVDHDAESNDQNLWMALGEVA